MEKVESGVRLNQEQQSRIAFIYTSLEQGKSLISLTEPPMQVCKLRRSTSDSPAQLPSIDVLHGHNGQIGCSGGYTDK